MSDDIRRRFEYEFNSRTLEYLPGFRDSGGRVVVALGRDAHCEAGHALATCLFNMLARAHRHVSLCGPSDEPLRCCSAFGHRTLGEATVGLARAINPYIVADHASPSSEGFVIGIGGVRHADLRLGADGFIAMAGPDATLVNRPASVWGALLAACLGAASAFHRAAGRPGALLNGEFSLWDLGASGGADGPLDPGPVDVGRVLQAGAGAVGCGLDLALATIGLRGDWTIVDGDFVDITNLNRQALFVARDTGWPIGPATGKAQTCGRRLRRATGAHVDISSRWYGEEGHVVDAPYDVILALANEHGVRGALQARQPTVLLHATTSARWSAQAHRHISGHDDCIECRIQPAVPAMKCSTGTVSAAGESSDASLPFLSVAAGLCLAAMLARLQHGGLMETPSNHFILDLAEPSPWQETVSASCVEGCSVRLPAQLRREIDAPSRWLHLDAA
jgi:molybdopterin/thiamine biosynthesis adenylyltransferase